MGSISFGMVLVAGRNLVPSPAAGITAFLTLVLMPMTIANLPVCANPQRYADTFGDDLSHKIIWGGRDSLGRQKYRRTFEYRTFE